MATSKPRMMITLDPETKAVLDDLAEAVGRPVATVVSSLLDEVRDQLSSTAAMTRAARAGNSKGVKQILTHMVGSAAAEMMTASQTELFGKVIKAEKKRKAGAK